VIRHLLKLVWRRKRANSLLIIEILASFLVIFAVLTLATSMITRWNQPIGFDYHDVWQARIEFAPLGEIGRNRDDSAERRALVAMLREIRTMPEVESVAAANTPPYGNGTWISGAHAGSRPRVDVTRDQVTDDYAKVLRIPILRGRWFSADDDASRPGGVVLGEDAARALFGKVDVVGQTLQSGDDEVLHVIGVVPVFRKDGELSTDHTNMLFDRYSLIETKTAEKGGNVPRYFVLRVRPGTPANFETTLIKRLHAVSPEYPVKIQHMEQQRAFFNKLFLAPAIIGAVIAGFLITMVALGLSGVLWQTVTRRTREIGLRRALGATGNEVNRQILLEVALLSTLAIIVGVVIVAQLPLIGAFRVVNPPAFMIGLAGALATIYSLTLLCGLYPSWLAGRVQPAQALHYE
jgi:putative ABC transport system permease protein